MDLKQLRYFTEIVDAGSVRQASLRVHISQPALTVAIQNLETELGISLFTRVGRSLTPTKEGLYFYRHARMLLAQSERLKVNMRAMKTLDKAEIRIAAPVMIASTVLAVPTAAFIQSYPGVQINFIQMGGLVDIEKALQYSEIDIGFLSYPPQGSELSAHPICERKVKAIVNKRHPLASTQSISWQDLFEYPILTLPKGYILHDFIKSKAAFYHNAANIVFESDIIHPIVQTLLSNDLVGILLEDIAELSPDLKAISIYDVKGSKQTMTASVFACHLGSEPLSHAARSYLDFLEGFPAKKNGKL